MTTEARALASTNTKITSYSAKFSQGLINEALIHKVFWEGEDIALLFLTSSMLSVVIYRS
jgi:hypothetical protein